jgi:F plasmid transfer operon protein TraF
MRRATPDFLLTALLAAVSLLVPCAASAQGFDPVTTRAAGMAGAFVAVTDDASAVYWNPGALASGALFSLVIDRTAAEATVADVGKSRSSTLFALSTPPVGLSYYRLRSSRVTPAAAGASTVQTLITHHTGVTLVQSLADGISVGTTLKLVRGIAAAGTAPSGNVEDLLDEANDLVGKASNRFDADAGVSLVRGAFRAGLTVRNLVSPTFDAAGGPSDLRLDRQARAGVGLASPLGFLVAIDLDLNAVSGPTGRRRELAVGSEARILPRAFVRAGLRMNTLSEEPGGHAPGVSVGGSYAALSSLWLETQASFGSEAAGRSWGVAARVAF